MVNYNIVNTFKIVGSYAVTEYCRQSTRWRVWYLTVNECIDIDDDASDAAGDWRRRRPSSAACRRLAAAEAADSVARSSGRAVRRRVRRAAARRAVARRTPTSQRDGQVRSRGHSLSSSSSLSPVVMVALWNRADHYIFMLWFVLLSSFFFFSSPNLSRRRLDVCHTSTHGVALVRI